ncbi:MAG: U32 family peptidase [Bacilli bacterium]|nr:U32 family peptidase [Bacilli bacterium]MBP3921317.1 U32 family peptidase [Bacilli bacterium]
MTKLMLIPSNNEMINMNVDAITLGIQNLSVNMPIYYTLEQIKKITKESNKEIFISLNKNMHSNDLENLKQTLIELSKLKIKGIMYYDIAVYNLSKKLNLKIDLVWAQEHMTTNYETINYWYKKNVKYTLLSTEISKHEILEIKQNTKSKLIVPLIGYYPMFVSKRHLIENYKKEFNLKNNSKINYIEKENKTYPIIDEEVTTVYTNAYLNLTSALNEFKQNNIDYVLINTLLITTEQIKQIIEIINYKKEYNEISKILNNTDTFFLNKESIYKVK